MRRDLQFADGTWNVPGTFQTRSVSFEVALFGSREATAADRVLESAAASRLDPLPFVVSLGLTPKAICWRCFAAQKERNFKKRERG